MDHQERALQSPNATALDKTGYCCQKADVDLLDALDTLYQLEQIAEDDVPHYRRVMNPTFRDVACSCPACAPDTAVLRILRCLALVAHLHTGIQKIDPLGYLKVAARSIVQGLQIREGLQYRTR